jgi:hypothetical protein
MRERLTEELGGAGRLTARQRVLVERAAYLQLRCAVLDKRIADGTFTDYDSKTYLAFSNSLRRAMEALGLERVIEPQPTLADIMNDIASAKARPAA